MASETTKGEIILPVNVAGTIQETKFHVIEGDMRYGHVGGFNNPIDKLCNKGRRQKWDDHRRVAFMITFLGLLWNWLAKERGYCAEIGKLKQQVEGLKYEHNVQVATDLGEKNRLTRENEMLRAQIEHMKIDADNRQRSRSDERLIKGLRMEIGECRSESENLENTIAGLEAHCARRTEKRNRYLQQLKRDHEQAIANLKKKVVTLEDRAFEQTRTLGVENKHCHKLLTQMEVEIQQWHNQYLQDSRIITAHNDQIEHLLKEKRQTRDKIKTIAHAIIRRCLRCENMTSITPVPQTRHNLESPAYKAGVRCAYHSGAEGHDTNDCWTLRRVVENLIEQEKIVLRDEEVPNVTNNPLLTHNNRPLIGMICEDKEFDTALKAIIAIVDAGKKPKTAPKLDKGEKKTSAIKVKLEEKVETKIVTMVPARNEVLYVPRGREVTGELPVNTFIGRYSNTQELNNSTRKRFPPKKPVSVEEAEVFFQKMKMPDYEVVDQLRKCPEQVSMLSLLMRSAEHQNILLKTLNEAYIPDDTSVEQLERMTERPWIHAAGAVPSTLHQMVKFEYEAREIVVHGEDEQSIYRDPSMPYLEEREGSEYTVYQL
ncbi:uncharacterized protein [Nicotiana sylvestris]|uniref:uncharacterized protein n=1 Tax=Nicotiana sylvestris TaxID=4096 RepID=UPI00388C8B26